MDCWWHSSLSFTILIHIVTFKLFIDVRQWNILTFVTSLSSIVFYYITVTIINSPGISMSLQPQITGVFSSMLNN